MNLYLKAVEPLDQSGGEDVLVLLDESGSMLANDLAPSRIGAVRTATERLLDEKLRRFPSDRVGIMGFSTGAREHYPLAEVGASAELIRAAIRRVDVNGGTDMAAGLNAAAVALAGGPGPARGILGALRRWIVEDHPTASQAGPTGGQRIIMLSDGANTGRQDPVQVAEDLKNRGIVIDTIGVAGSPRRVDEATLKAIASANRDGTKRYVFIKDSAQLLRKFEKLAGHLRRLEV